MKLTGNTYLTRIVLVGFLTGFAQIISLLSVSFLKTLDQSLVYDIGNYESLIVVFTAVISLGLQVVTVRHIAISKNWQQILINSQRDRLTFSFFVVFGVICFDFFIKTIQIENIIFYSVIPLIALNSDYAFYGKGEPIKGAFLSFLRVSILSLFIIFSVVFENQYIRISFIIAILITYFLIGFLSSRFNQQAYFVRPKINFYKSYLKSMNVGLASFSLVFFGLGVVSYASLFYTEGAIANAYLLLKIYVFYVGIKRLIVQILFKELTSEKLIKTIDHMGIVVGSAIIVILIYYPEYSIKFFVKDYEKSAYNLYYLLPAIFFTSISITSSVNLLLKLKDGVYSIGFILGAILVLISVFLFSLYDNSNEAFLYVSISVGELIVILIHGWGLSGFKFFKERFLFIVGTILILFSLNYFLLMIDNKLISLFILGALLSGYILYTLKFKAKTT
jgi:hypothetical protein